jgi:hypothetical protein
LSIVRNEFGQSPNPYVSFPLTRSTG